MSNLVLIVPLLVFSSSLADEMNYAENYWREGVCLSTDMMSTMCMINSDIGTRIVLAQRSCDEKFSDHEIPSSGKVKPTLSTDEKDRCSVNFGLIQQFFNHLWERKSCVFRQVGWVDEEDQILTESVAESLNSLPGSLANGLADTDNLCLNRSMDATLENLFASDQFESSSEINGLHGENMKEECLIGVDNQQLLEIEITLQKLAFFRCVHDNFLSGCGNYILQGLRSMVKEMGK